MSRMRTFVTNSFMCPKMLVPYLLQILSFLSVSQRVPITSQQMGMPLQEVTILTLKIIRIVSREEDAPLNDHRGAAHCQESRAGGGIHPVLSGVHAPAPRGKGFSL